MGVNGIYGLSGSGIDVESMVKVGMLGRQKEYDKMQQQYTKDEWQKQAYNSIYGSIQTFNNSTLTQYKLQSNMNAKSASTTSDAVNVSANGNAPILNHKIQVNELSSTAYFVSTNSLQRYYSETNSNTSDQTSIDLADVLFHGLQENISTGSKMANVHEVDDASTGTLYNLKDVAFELQISDGTRNANGSLKYSTVKYTYKQLLDGRTFNDLVSDINNLGLNVRASYDSVNDSFSFYNKEGGSDNGVYFNFRTDSDNENTAKAAERAQNLIQGLHLYQSKDGVLYGQDGKEVADAKTSSNYFGSGNSYAPASIVSTKSFTLPDSDEDVVGIGDDLERILFNGGLTSVGDNAYEYTTFSSDEAVAVSGDDAAISFKIGDEEFNYTFSRMATDSVTMETLIEDINNSGLGITASYEDGKLTLQSDESGYNQNISLTAQNDITKNLFSNFGLANGNTNAELSFDDEGTISVNGTGTSGSSGSSFGVAGTNGSVTIDGVTYDNITDNKITTAGVTYTLLNKTDSAVNVNVVQDTQGIIDRVKSFVEDYNKLLASLYEKYDEKQYSDYKPLTESQKEQMTEEQINKWEEKAKSGMLYHDSTLNKIIYKMRDAISTPIDGLNGKYDSIFSLGIKTTGLKGQLTLDEDKLKAALNEDPDSVYNIFGRLDAKDTFSGNGVAQRLGDVFNDSMKLIKNRAGTDDSINDDSDLGVLMRNLQSKMSDFRKLMDSFENKLYKKYDAMEVALSRLGMQLSFITGGQ